MVCRSSWKLRFLFVFLAAGLVGISESRSASSTPAERPNFVIIFADDLGYGDLGCYGHPTIRTPNLDRMAREGMRFTDFYAAAPVCTPSRAGLLTGRLPIRSGMCSDKNRVLFPRSAGGLPENEITIAEALKEKGYATACIGKWHLGHLPQYLPTRNGFDFFFGLPYSNDMDRVENPKGGPTRSLHPLVEDFNVPLFRNEKIIERPADQVHLTQRYTREAIEFIRRNKEKPFFLYFPHTFPHIPLFASEDFKGRSPRGLYGDVVEELDWSVGQILDFLKQEDLAENTLVFFTSDNGPWLIMKETGGSAGLLRDGKGSTWEGGMREPGIAWWPGKIRPASICRGLASTMDLYTTCLTLAGVGLPTDRVIDGVDMSPLLFQEGPSNRDTYFYYRGETLYAIRKGPFKAHYITRPAYGRGDPVSHDPPELYHLGVDPSETMNVAEKYPAVLEEIEQVRQAHLKTVEKVESQLEKKLPKTQ